MARCKALTRSAVKGLTEMKWFIKQRNDTTNMRKHIYKYPLKYYRPTEICTCSATNIQTNTVKVVYESSIERSSNVWIWRHKTESVGFRLQTTKTRPIDTVLVFVVISEALISSFIWSSRLWEDQETEINCLLHLTKYICSKCAVWFF